MSSKIQNTAAPKSAPSELHSKLEEIVKSAASLADTTTKQLDRLREIARLENERATTREAVDGETIPFAAGSKKLAEIAAELELHEFQRAKRCKCVETGFGDVRQQVLDLKWATLRTLSRAADSLLQTRQQSLADEMAKWGGAEVRSMMPAAVIADACPTLKQLEALRATLQDWRPDEGLESFVAVITPVLDYLTPLPAPSKPEALYGGFSERERIILAAWRNSEAGFEVVQEFTDIGSANAKFYELRAQSGYLGYDKLIRFESASPDGEVSFDHPSQLEIDYRQNSNSAMESGSGDQPVYLERVQSWLAPAVS